MKLDTYFLVFQMWTIFAVYEFHNGYENYWLSLLQGFLFFGRFLWKAAVNASASAKESQ